MYYAKCKSVIDTVEDEKGRVKKVLCNREIPEHIRGSDGQIHKVAVQHCVCGKLYFHKTH